MNAEWDPRKAEANFSKHGVRFSEALPVLEDDLAITIIDSDSDETEARFVTVGMDAKARLLVVVYVVRGETYRIISARRADQHEREEYEQEAR